MGRIESLSDRKIFALIPARGGSKGIRNKNLQTVGGESLLSRAIRRSIGSSQSVEVWVSSDSIKILEISKSLGANCHPRDPEAAKDTSLAKDVVLDFCRSKNLNAFDVILYLQPTSPFRSTHSIDRAIELFSRTPNAPMVGVRRASQHPSKMVKVGSDGLTFDPNLVEFSPTANRQQLEEFWYPNGALYIFTVQDFFAQGDIPVVGCVAFEMSEYESMDVDTPFDLELCERMRDFVGS